MKSASDFIDFPGKGGPRIERINETCAEFFGTSPAAITGQSRKHRIVVIRHIAFWLARRLTRHSYPDIGLYMGSRDHTTIMHGVRQTEMRRDRDENWRKMTDYLEQELRG